ncbi:hypothetical protein WMW72_10735 [Paenibacillus filicis]|uniref:MarR family transcriptional regulator n=2 Tax=Paenibacillus filicis TaxID=669464 RepID=A0ABU9DHN2_9BACL
MIKLNHMQANLLELIINGASRATMKSQLRTSHATIMKELGKLELLGVLERLPDKGSERRYSPLSVQFEIDDRRRPVRVPKKRFSRMKFLVRNYGKEKIRFISYQKDISDVEYIARKTDIRVAEVVDIMSWLEIA